MFNTGNLQPESLARMTRLFIDTSSFVTATKLLWISVRICLGHWGIIYCMLYDVRLDDLICYKIYKVELLVNQLCNIQYETAKAV